jgi:L-iditol 2-dehydrogenase
MKAVQLTGIRRMEITDVPEPRIERDRDVLIRVSVVGICGSDIHYYAEGKIGSQVVKYPYRIGHECSGVVEAVGKAVKRVKVGDEVVVNPAQSCYECDQCKAGRENTCRNLRFLGTPGQGDGCLCEYIVMSEHSLFNVTGRMSLDTAALCEPFSIGVYSVQQAGVRAGGRVAIFGCGPIGLSCMVAAKAAGAERIYMTDRIDDRCRAAKQHGACWTGNPGSQDIAKAICSQEPAGIDAALECAGEQSTLDEAVEVLRPGGTLTIVGIPRFDRVSFDISKVRRKELTIVNIRRQNRCEEKAIELVAGKSADIDFMLTHKFSLDNTADAFELVEAYRNGVIKAVIEL